MSVIVRKLLKPRGSPIDTQVQHDNHVKHLLGSLLDANLEKPTYATISREVLLYAKVVVDICQRPHYRAFPVCEGFSRRVAIIAVSLEISVSSLIPDFRAVIDREIGYVEMLTPLVGRIQELISQSLGILGKLGKSSGFWSFQFEEEDALEACLKDLEAAYSAFNLRMSILVPDAKQTNSDWLQDSDADGRHLKWSEINSVEDWEFQVSGKSGVSPFWFDASNAQLEGKTVMVKQYNELTTKTFQRDLETLKELRHSNLPFVYGYSHTRSSNPFIILTMEPSIPFLEYVPLLCKSSPKTAVSQIWQNLVTMKSTADFLVQREAVHDLPLLGMTLLDAMVDSNNKVVLPIASEFKKPRFLKAVKQDEVPDAFEYILQAWQSSDHYTPRILRPLYYGLTHAPREFLAPSVAQIASLEDPKLVLTQWRPGLYDDPPRSFRLPVSTLVENSTAVGDIGVLEPDDSGELVFSRLGNVQHEIGGFRMIGASGNFESQISEEVAPGIWKLQNFVYLPSHIYGAWSQWIPLEACYRYFVNNADRLGQIHNVPPENLILVTGFCLCVDIAPSNLAENQDLEMFAVFGERGEFRGVRQYNGCQSGTTIDHYGDIQPDDSMHVELTYSTHPYLEDESVVNGLQLESDEMLNLGSKQLASLISQFEGVKFGDVGYFIQRRGMRGEFVSLFNINNLSQGVEISTWYGNPCEQIAPGVWRSRTREHTNVPPAVLSWNVSFKDFESDQALEAFRENYTSEFRMHDMQIVNSVDHQVHCSLTQCPQEPDSRLFVHFDGRGDLEAAYWSTGDEPRSKPFGKDVSSTDGILLCHGIAREFGAVDDSRRNSRNIWM